MPVVYGKGGSETRAFFSKMPLDLKDTKDVVPHLPLPHEISSLHRTPDTEFYVGNRVFLSPLSVLVFQNEMIENGQHRVVVFAYTHIGMGSVLVDAYDPRTHSVFQFEDGVLVHPW